MGLNSTLYRCKVVHDRREPKKNFFSYNIFMFLIDLDELPVLSKRLNLFSHNRFNVFSFYDSDHFKKTKTNDKGQSAKSKLIEYLRANKIDQPPVKVLLLTHPRIFGHVFNPVSFYYCYNEEGKIFCVVAEVTNTYGEMKMYLVNQKKDGWYRAIHHKLFYISPFTELDDYLDLKVGLPLENLKIFINDFAGKNIKVKTMLKGKQKSISNSRLLKYMLRFPLITLQVVSLIHWQAFKLLLKGVKYIPKDENPQLQKNIYFSKKQTVNAKIDLQNNSVETIGQYEAG